MVKIEWKHYWFGLTSRFEAVCPKTDKPINILRCYGCKSLKSVEIHSVAGVVTGVLQCESEKPTATEPKKHECEGGVCKL